MTNEEYKKARELSMGATREMTQVARVRMPENWSAVSMVIDRRFSEPDWMMFCIDASLPPREVAYVMCNAVAQHQQMGLRVLFRFAVELLCIRIARGLRVLK